MTASPNILAAQAQHHREQAASAPDRVAFSTTGRSGPAADSRVAQLRRCAERNRRILAEANAVPAYLGGDSKRRAVVNAANWRAHIAYLRLTSAEEAIDALLSA